MFVIHTTLNISEDSMATQSVPATLTSVHMRFPMNTCQGEESSGRIIPIKRNYLFNLGFFFLFQMQMAIFLTAYLPTFSEQLYFRRIYFFTLLNYFDTTVTLSEHLFIQSSWLFEELRFRKSIFSQQLFFRIHNF